MAAAPDNRVTLGASLPTGVALGPAANSDRPDPERRGNGFATQFADDLAALAHLGVSDVRLGFDWARLQPRPGDFDGRWVEWYADVITAASSCGIGIWAGLLERTIPAWFDDEGGFADAKATSTRWPRFVEGVADIFGDRIAGWFPIDDPIGIAARVDTDDARRHGEIVDTLVVAWRDAWRILRGGPPVAGSFSVRHVRPDDATPPALERARREDHLRLHTFIRGLRDGTVVIPGRSDRELADLAGAIDIIGVKLRTDLGEDATISDDSLRRWQERCQTLVHRVSDIGPDRPMTVIHRVNRRHHTETPRDCEVLTEAFLRAVNACRHDGLDLRSVFVEPGIAADPAGAAHALLDWDRHETTLAAAWQRRSD